MSARYVLYVGRGTWRTYKNVGTGPARRLEMITRAGIEEFFEEVSVPALNRSSPPPFEKEDLDKIQSIALMYGLEIRPIPESDS